MDKRNKIYRDANFNNTERKFLPIPKDISKYRVPIISIEESFDK